MKQFSLFEVDVLAWFLQFLVCIHMVDYNNVMKSRRRRMEGEMACSWVRKSDKLERKEGFGLGGSS